MVKMPGVKLGDRKENWRRSRPVMVLPRCLVQTSWVLVTSLNHRAVLSLNVKRAWVPSGIEPLKPNSSAPPVGVVPPWIGTQLTLTAGPEVVQPVVRDLEGHAVAGARLAGIGDVPDGGRGRGREDE
jgi:hypothetical protein